MSDETKTFHGTNAHLQWAKPPFGVWEDITSPESFEVGEIPTTVSFRVEWDEPQRVGILRFSYAEACRFYRDRYGVPPGSERTKRLRKKRLKAIAQTWLTGERP